MMQLLLLGTDPCHLCDKLKRELDSYQMFSKIPFNYTVIDVVDDDELYDKYELKIPVILHQHSQMELYYPFDFAALMALLDQVSD